MRAGKLSQSDKEDLILDLVHAIALSKSTQDIVLFLQDLLTQQEMFVLSKRLRIAKLLLKGWTYETIEKNLHTSHATVARIAAWIDERGDGFRNIIAKLPEEKNVDPLSFSFDWDRIKRKYSLYFWPELLLEEIIKGANAKQRQRIGEVLDRLKEKSELHKKIEKLLYPKSHTT